MECPHCRLLNPPSAQRCDCGYDFLSRSMQASYLEHKRGVDQPRDVGYLPAPAYTVYRVCIWLPILVPLVVVLAVSALGRPVSEGIVVEVLFYSLLVGGLPYAAPAAWATWWVGGRSEPEIRRLMFRAPLLMVAIFAPLALLMGAFVGQPGPFAAVAALGSAIILTLGYAYVGLTLLLRYGLGPRRELTASH